MSSCGLIKGITPKIGMLCFVLINSVILNLLRVRIKRKFSKNKGGGRGRMGREVGEGRKKTDLFGNLQVATTLPEFVIVDIRHDNEHGADNVLLVPVIFQHVAWSDGEFPVAAQEILDGVVLARELDHFLCVGEGVDFLSLEGLAYWCLFVLGCGGEGKLEHLVCNRDMRDVRS